MCGTLGLVLAWLLIGSASTARDNGFIVIVHPDNPVTTVEPAFLRDVYFKRTARWPHGTRIHPIDLAGNEPARDHFVRDILKKTPAQLRAYWVQRIFSGVDVPPRAAESHAAVIGHVLSSPGSLGYLPSDVSPRGAKILKIK